MDYQTKFSEQEISSWDAIQQFNEISTIEQALHCGFVMSRMPLYDEYIDREDLYIRSVEYPYEYNGYSTIFYLASTISREGLQIFVEVDDFCQNRRFGFYK